jgi:hypothetical protein
MHAKLRRGYVSIAAMIVAVVLLSITLLTPAVSTTADFSIFNSGWNGTSELAVSAYEAGKFAPSFTTRATGTDLEVVQLGFDKIGLDPTASTLVVIGPTLGFTADEGRIVGDFVRAGGVLLLADDFGTGNQLLEGMGSSTRISGVLVMDLAFDKKPEFSVCFDLQTDPLTRNVSSILLNYPSSIITNSATTSAIAFSSIASWQDVNGNNERDLDEPSGPFVIMAREELGNGTVIVLSDPSVLINGMAKYLNNSALDENVIAQICTGRASVFFDESHRDFFDPVAVTMRFSGSLSDEAKGVIVVLAFVLVLWIATDYLDRGLALVIQRLKILYFTIMSILLGWRKKAPAPAPPSPVQLEEEVMARHPDWRPGIVHYIAKEHGRHTKAALEREE